MQTLIHTYLGLEDRMKKFTDYAEKKMKQQSICMALETRRYKFMSAGYFEPQKLQKVPLHQIVGFINRSQFLREL